MPSPALQPLMAYVPPTEAGQLTGRWNRGRTVVVAAGIGVAIAGGAIAAVLLGGSHVRAEPDRVTTAGPSELAFVAAANAACTTDWAQRSAALRVSLARRSSAGAAGLSAQTVGIETAANSRLLTDVTAIAHPSEDATELAGIASATTALNAQWALRVPTKVAAVSNTMAAFDAAAVTLSTDYNEAGLAECFPVSAQTLS